MPFGMGPLGWMYYGMPYGYRWMGAYSPYSWGHYPYHGGYFPCFSPWGYLPKEDEKAMLEDQVSVLEDQLEQMRKRLAELEK